LYRSAARIWIAASYASLHSKQEVFDMIPDVPNAFPVRRKEGMGWQVLLIPENTWLECQNEDDARVIAQAPVLEYQSLAGLRAGEQFAQELEAVSEALSRYRIGFGSRFFGRAAEYARRVAE
jgi:hypothetical protein